MNINYKQAQFELFPGTPGSSTDTGRPRYLFANLNLSVENLVILGIVILMTMVFIFSLGVEKGKKLIPEKNAAAPEDPLSPVPLAVIPASKVVLGNSPAIMPAPNFSAQNTFSATGNNVSNGQGKINNDSNKLQPNKTSKKENPLTFFLNKPYTIQVASFKDGKYAQKEAVILKNKKFDVFVVSKGNFSIVCVGKFSNKEEANGTVSKLKKNYNDCLVRRL